MGLLKSCRECDWTTEGCQHCQGTGYYPIDDNQIVYVNVYSVERCYGGPEEGGWWYNWLECEESYPCQNKVADLMKEELERKYEGMKHGDIYSVLGGTDIAVNIEERPSQSETRERPQYE